MGTAIEALEQKHYAVAQAATQLRHAVVAYQHAQNAARSQRQLAYVRMTQARLAFDAAAARVV